MFLQKIEDVRFAHIIINEYAYLCGRGISGINENEVPVIGELIEEVWQDAQLEVQLDYLQQAIEKGKHAELGMSKKEFTDRGMAGMLPSSYMKTVSVLEIQEQVLDLLRNYNMSFSDYEYNIVNSPIGNGVW